MKTEIPTLAILPVKSLWMHEWYDPQRTPPLIKRIQMSNVFLNPPIVMPAGDASQHYVVLDGANRTASIRALGCPHILAQVVEPHSCGLLLRTWNHILLGIDPSFLVENIKQIQNLDVVSSNDAEIELPTRGSMSVALLQTMGGSLYALGAPTAELIDRVKILNKIVDSYKKTALVDRTSFDEVSHLTHIYPDLSALIVFPKFDISDIIRLSSSGVLLPPGITRTTISPCALHVNIPLEVLSSSESLAYKNSFLNNMIQQRIQNGRIQYFSKPTYFFDE